MSLLPEPGACSDPSGRVHRWRPPDGSPERVLRGVSARAAPVLDRLIHSPWYRDLVESGAVADSWWLDRALPESRALAACGWPEALEHPRIHPVTYPFEWPFSTLRAATAHHLLVLESALAHGWLLKDAAPANVLPAGLRPVFVDVHSFVPDAPGRWWRGHRQLLRTALHPLLLESVSGIDPRPWLRGDPEGLPLQAAARLVPPSLRHGVIGHVHLPAWAERSPWVQRLPARPPSPGATLALVRSLRRTVERLPPPAPAGWTRYPEVHAYAPEDAAAKRAFVLAHLRRTSPATVWDLGANTGAYSVLAASACDRVVAIEPDPPAAHAAASALLAACPDRASVVVCDAIDATASPTPRRPVPLIDRAPPGNALCLALLHHLRTTRGVPLRDLVGWLASLRCPIALEWVDRSDPMFATLADRHDDSFDDYCAEHLEALLPPYFDVLRRLALPSGTRTLLSLAPRPP